MNTGYIYNIENIMPGHERFGWHYIGQGMTYRHTQNRIRRHFNGKGSRFISNDIMRYGKENFYVTLHPTFDNGKAALDADETSMIKAYNCMDPNGYNFTVGGEGGSPSPETRKKLSIANTGRLPSPETRKKLSIASAGKPKSAEHCKNISIAHTGKVRSDEARKNMSKPRSAEHCKNISIAHTGKPWSAARRAAQERRKI